MKRMMALPICACVLALMLASCEQGGTGGLGTVTVYVSNGGSVNGDDAKSGNAPDANGEDDGDGTQAASNGEGQNSNGSLSISALSGIWYNDDGWGTSYIWSFSPDGDYLMLMAGGTTWRSAGGTNWDSAWNGVEKGKFRVSGNTIECYNCLYSGGFQLSADLTGVPLNTAMNDLFNSPLKDPYDKDDHIMEFEFDGPMSLRLVGGTNRFTMNDDIFEYYGAETRDVAVPSQKLPSRAWPSSYLKHEIPVFDYDCRIRSIDTSNTTEIHIYVDMFSREDYVDYVRGLVRDGWENDSGDDDTEQCLASGGWFILGRGAVYSWPFPREEWISFYISGEGFLVIGTARATGS